MEAEKSVLDKILVFRERECYERKSSFNRSVLSSEKFCDLIFDQILCWPPTKAGTLASLPCPDYFVKSEFRKQATKRCDFNGDWYVDANTNDRWTNYSECGILYVQKLDPFDPDPLENSSIYQLGVPIIKNITHFGYGISIVTLILALVIFSTIKKLRCARNRLHMHLFISFIMRAFMSCLKDAVFVHGVALASDVVYDNGVPKSFNPNSSWICKAITSFRQYFIIANYMMVLVEGVYLHNLIFLNLFADNGCIKVYYALGWGLPLAFTIPWIFLRTYFEDEYCWTRTKTYISVLIHIPVGLSIIVNSILFVTFVRVLCIKLNSMYIQQRKIKYRKLTRATLIMVPLFGVPYTISSLMSFYATKNPIVDLVWLFFDQTFTSFQGFFAALIYCLTNSEVRMEIKLKYVSFWTAKNLHKHQRTISSTQHISIPLQGEFGPKDEGDRITYF